MEFNMSGLTCLKFKIIPMFDRETNSRLAKAFEASFPHLIL